MRIFICWLITLSDLLGIPSGLYILYALGRHTAEDLGVYAAYIPTDFHVVVAGSVAAIIPAIATAMFGSINYNLLLSWAIIRWMSPLNIFTNKIYYFFKTLFLTGAVWAALITFFLYKCFPNTSFEWVLNMIKGFVHLFI